MPILPEPVRDRSAHALRIIDLNRSVMGHSF